MPGLRSLLQDVRSEQDLAGRAAQLKAELAHQPDLGLRISGPGAWAARSGLCPLLNMSRIAASVSASSLTTRLPQEQMPAELAELTQAFNGMLGRLDDGF